MRSNIATINRRKKYCRGQAVVEYVIFLAVTLAFIAALVFLMRTVGEHGEKNVERIGYAVP